MPFKKKMFKKFQNKILSFTKSALLFAFIKKIKIFTLSFVIKLYNNQQQVIFFYPIKDITFENFGANEFFDNGWP